MSRLDTRAGGSPPPALEAHGLAKRFGGQLALAGVDLTVEQGEVLALLGENGSGKSTLVKILSGYHAPEPGGQLKVAGRSVALPIPHGAYRESGLSFVFQDLGLALGLRVVENLFVGRRTQSAGSGLSRIGWRSERRRAKAILDGYQVAIDPAAVVGDLRPTDQALLAIVRAAEELAAFRRSAPPARATTDPSSGRPDATGAVMANVNGVLVLDEPTVFLPQDEKVFLFDLVRRIVAEGTAVLFVSHDLTAIRQIASRAVVLRDGRLIGDVAMASTSDGELVELISGHRLSRRRSPAASEVAAPSPTVVAALERTYPSSGADGAGDEATALVARGITGGRLHGADLTVGAGEIVGVAGLLGSGAEDLPYALFGALPRASGTLRAGTWSGDVGELRPRGARRAGLALVPADRKQQGSALELSVGENMMSLVLGDYFRFGLLARGRLRRAADERCRAYGVRPAQASARMASLSGGNQQRVVLARWLERPPRVLLLHEPTQGVDVATRAEIYDMLRGLARGGIAILWVSTDFDELAAISDRVLICADGAVRTQLASAPFSRDQLTAEVYAASAPPLARGA